MLVHENRQHVYWYSGWWFQPLWKILVSWDDYSQYMENKKCSKPPSSITILLIACFRVTNDKESQDGLGSKFQLQWYPLAMKHGNATQPLSSMNIHENPWASMNIHEHPWTSMKIHENPLKCSISCDDFPIFHWTFAISIDLQQGLGPNTWTLVSRRSVWGALAKDGQGMVEDNCAFAMKYRNLVGFPFKQDYTMVCMQLDHTLCIYNIYNEILNLITYIVI